jgi:hypothetical protein
MTVHVGYQFDLFAAYAKADAWWVRGYLLPALALPPSRVITQEEFRPGTPVVEEFARAVAGSRFTVVVLSPAFLADQWADLGQQLATHLGVAERRNRLVPVLLRPCELPLGLDFRVRLDCTREAEWEPAMVRLRALLDQPEPTLERVPCPYPGMVPYGDEHAGLFFGRDRETYELLRRLPHVACLFLIGPSGAGKSSVVFAGLVPELRRRDPDGWLVRSLRPGAEPLQALQEAVGCPPDPRPVQDDPAASVDALLSRHPPARRLLLVVDQLEEVFVQAPATDRQEFLSALRALRSSTASVATLTLRADFYPELMHSQLWPVAEAERVEVVPLRGAALREAIERPAARCGVDLQPTLVERLVADAATEPGVLPLLQETLRLLWEGMRHRVLTLAAYEALGREGASGMVVALATWADASLVGLSRAQQAVARRVFLRLVHLGEGREDTRRR